MNAPIIARVWWCLPWVVCAGLAAATGARAASDAAGTAAQSERVSQWQRDLDTVRDVFLPADRSYPPEARAEAGRRLARLRDRVPDADNTEIEAELARIAALAGNAHTRAYLLRNRGVWHRYPLRVWRFDDGWRIVAARDEAERWIGARVVAIGGRPVDAVFAALRPLFAGNESWAEYMGSYTLTSPEALRGAVEVDAGGRTAFELEVAGQVHRVQLSPTAAPRREVPEESWWFLSPVHPATQGWRHVLSRRALPAVLRGAAAYYRFDRCADQVLYVQFNRAVDEPGAETIAQWGDRLLQQLKSAPPRQLVIDLRFNTGGDLNKAQPLVEQIAKLPLAAEPGRLSVLSGISTFSAGITPLAWLRMHTAAQVVGRHPGDEPEYWSEGGNVVLPHAGWPMHFANGLHVYGKQRRSSQTPYLALEPGVADLVPDRTVPWTWADYLAGRDRVAEVALQRPLVCPPI